MSGFLYFRSGDTRPLTKEGIAKLGLSYAFTGSIENRQTTGNSPSGKAGSVLAEDARHQGKTIGYYPDKQTWRKLPNVEGRPELWVGYWNDAKPGPEDLERKPMLPGEVSMMLGDGKRWVIPTLTEFDDAMKGECQLPAPLEYDDEGNLFTTKPTGIYGQLWDAVHPVALGVCFGSSEADAEIKEPSDAEVRKAAFTLLRANYVVDMPELVALGCLRNDTTFRTIVMASCRGKWLIEAIDEITKKNETPAVESGSDSSDGKAA
jgi:hypothetical protein